MKIKHLKVALHLIIIIYTTSCVSYSPLPYGFKTSYTIDGVYNNDPIKNPFGDYKLWDFIHNKSSVTKDSLYVSLKMLGKNRIQAKLLDRDSVVAEKNMKIKLKEDSCYYTGRKFYIIPILPVLWFYSNEQKRFAVGVNSLILERTSNRGGAFIIMAGNNKYNDSWEYEKKK
jgi:hypothetical protein